jgi:predicted amidophosphoribosyltransferase
MFYNSSFAGAGFTIPYAMRTKPCPSCGITLASNASSCPRCGRQFTSPVAWVLAILAAFFILGAVLVGVFA